MKFLSSKIDKEKLMLVDMIYHPPRKDNDRVDCLDVIYKDLSTGEKKIKSITNPEIEIYFTKNEYRDYDYNKAFMDINKCEKQTCQYKTLPWYIAKQAGDQYVNELKRMVEMGNYRDIQKIHTYPYVFGSDIPIDVFYRVNWLLEYDNEQIKPITKSFADIEVDTIDIEGFPRDGECPINAVTLVDDSTKSSYTFLLKTKNNPLIDDFINDIDSFIEDLHQSFDESYGYLDYKIYMYEDERDLIIDTFRLINTLKPDYCMFWNGFGSKAQVKSF